MSRLKHLAKVRRTNKRFFISHASALRDSEIARCLYEALCAMGLDGFYDGNLKLGKDFVEELEKKIVSSNVFVLILSRTAFKSRWVKDEYDIAIRRQNAGKRLSIIPLLIEDCEHLVSRRFLGNRQWIRFYKRPYTEALKELLEKGFGLTQRQSEIKARASARFFSDIKRSYRRYWLGEFAPKNKGDPFLIDNWENFTQSRIFRWLKIYSFPEFTADRRTPAPQHIAEKLLVSSWAANDLRKILNFCLHFFWDKDSLEAITVGDFAKEVESAIIREARGSLERMFQLCNLLFKETARRWADGDPEKMIIRADWEAALRKVAK